MEEQTLKVKCPCCGAVLSVKNNPNLRNMALTCPNCKTKSRFTAYIPFVSTHIAVNPDVLDDDSECETQLGPTLKEKEVVQNLLSDESNVNGRLVLLPDGAIFELEIGVNIIGRKANSSTADIQIPTKTKLMSRCHSIIEVKKVSGKGLVYYLSNCENKNDTYIGINKLEQGDCIVLKNGDQIRMADVKLCFEIV